MSPAAAKVESGRASNGDARGTGERIFAPRSGDMGDDGASGALCAARSARAAGRPYAGFSC